jgi:hypothetical protein
VSAYSGIPVALAAAMRGGSPLTICGPRNAYSSRGLGSRFVSNDGDSSSVAPLRVVVFRTGQRLCAREQQDSDDRDRNKSGKSKNAIRASAASQSNRFRPPQHNTVIPA